jgi:hypothetical protein
MKVYIVTKGEYDDYRILGCFLNNENAKNFCDVNNSEDSLYECKIEIYNLDDNLDNNLDKISLYLKKHYDKGYNFYRVGIDFKGNIDLSYSGIFSLNNYDFKEIKKIESETLYMGNIILFFTWAKNLKSAIKICDKRRLSYIKENKLIGGRYERIA